MTDIEFPKERAVMTPAKRRRNLLLGLILAASALGMYASIFFRLAYNPLH